MRPAHLPSPRRVPGVATPAIAHQPPPEALPQACLGHLAPARRADHTPADPLRHRGPQPRTLLAFPPAGRIQVCRQVCRRWLWDIRSGLRHGLGHRLPRRVLQVGERPQPHLHPTQVLQGARRGPFRQRIGPGAQGRARLDPRADPPRRYPSGHVRAGLRTTGRTDQTVPRIRGHAGLYGRDLGHLLPLGRGILPLQRVLAVVTALRRDGDHDVHLLHRPQPPRLPCMAGLSARATPRGLAPRPFAQGLGRVARRGARRGARGLLHLLPQRWDRRLQRRHTALQCAEVRLCLGWGALPYLWWYGDLAVHGQRFYAASALPGKGVSQ
jgi:hypothetical protein